MISKIFQKGYKGIQIVTAGFWPSVIVSVFLCLPAIIRAVGELINICVDCYIKIKKFHYEIKEKRHCDCNDV